MCSDPAVFPRTGNTLLTEGCARFLEQYNKPLMQMIREHLSTEFDSFHEDVLPLRFCL